MKQPFERPHGIYCITDRPHSLGRSSVDVVRAMLKGGARIIQYREKEGLSAREMLSECREIRRLTHDAGALFLVNDHLDLALLTDADGVHIGQDDLPLPEVRKLVGDRIIGLSTHSIKQAREAAALGADYIGVGPIFRTFTKKNVCDPVGCGYLEEVVREIQLPFVAIGGIKEHNIDEVLSRGARTVCVVTGVTEAEDIAETVRRLDKIVRNGRGK
jgi:thiamine-phosphate pyrophosphorylase